MSAPVILDGNALAAVIKAEIRERSEAVELKRGRKPHLAAVIVGEDGASKTYVGNKVKSCREAGMDSSLIELSADTSEEALLSVVRELNARDDIDGYIVQLPLPKHIDSSKVLLSIDPRKDVDGFHPDNAGLLMLGMPRFVPATPLGITRMITHYGVPVKGKHVVIIGRSNIVGRPLSVLLNSAAVYGNATVTVCHSHTPDLKSFTLQADVLIAALGKPGFVGPDMVKEGAAVIDVGITRLKDPAHPKGYRIAGDVDRSVMPKTSFFAPVPGGVGPLTVAALMLNTLHAAEHEKV
jgi:methylenetetrahydrofolate dehydrogenase (NADP+)/methenyltetrahydrofolate cyclohydrolase